MKLQYFGLLFFLILFCCSKEKISETTIKPKVILIQPFKDLSQRDLKEVVENIRKIYPEIRVLEPIDFPKNSYYAPRNRYRADSIIKYLNSKTANGFITLGLTSKDISVTKGKNPDFGIMGLGFKPGKACVASKFRLDKKNNEQFYKVAIHELGHTEGLNHCPIKTCFMRDAEGGNPTNEETDFCEKCKNYLKTKNWKFN
ncbi:archaemetzincin [Halpernia humi]|uniref:Archaemetzincin n=1 Tax=Halpernia humi TaxID=493375 RepID=A0A1H5YQP9_9FLAO|nr:Zn-dependent protease [Halpernia humi]SEG26411.1 archaemetzincin [Halpernia humi]